LNCRGADATWDVICLPCLLDSLSSLEHCPHEKNRIKKWYLLHKNYGHKLSSYGWLSLKAIMKTALSKKTKSGSWSTQNDDIHWPTCKCSTCHSRHGCELSSLNLLSWGSQSYCGITKNHHRKLHEKLKNTTNSKLEIGRKAKSKDAEPAIGKANRRSKCKSSSTKTLVW
jgi:hypothetical protein